MKISQTLNNSEIQIEKEKKIGGNEIISKVIVVCWSFFSLLLLSWDTLTGVPAVANPCSIINTICTE